MTELAVLPAEQMDSMMRYAQLLADASLLPDAYRKQPANVLLAMQAGQALGVSTQTAIQGIHVIKGKTSMSAGLMHALVLRAGHRIRVQGDDSRAVVSAWRKDDPEFEYRVEWTMERAKRAGLLGKADSGWAKYPAAMLRARALAESCRMAFPDVMQGMGYIPEELESGAFDDDTPVAAAEVEVADDVVEVIPEAEFAGLVEAMESAQSRDDALQVYRTAQAAGWLTMLTPEGVEGGQVLVDEWLRAAGARFSEGG